VSAGRPLIAFVGALGHDMNKGFDTLWRAWTQLCAGGRWDAELVVAGGGRGVSAWRERAADAGLGARVRVLGFTERVVEVLAASDLLVSPVRYEAFGLNVQEAVCRGVPALVSRTAGVAELYPADLSEMLLSDPTDAADLAARLLRWRGEIDLWKRRFAPFAARLRRHTWAEMAAEIVRIVEGKEIVSVADGAAERVA
jgi:glycosyltransferase involved in cell wall biosynthesis